MLSETSPATGFKLNVTEEDSGTLIRQLSLIGVKSVSYNAAILYITDKIGVNL